MPLTLAIGHLTDRGRVREGNEDGICVLMPPNLAPDIDAVLAVADGMGGHQAGEIASKFIADNLTKLFASTGYREWVNFNPSREDYYVLVLKEIIERLNAELHEMARSRDEWRGMGTTATVALVVGKKLYVGHVGDSRGYLFSNQTLRQLTKDHSWVMDQVEQKKMTLAEASSDSRKNQLLRALGPAAIVRVDRVTADLNPGDALVLCSDGLTNMVSDADIQQAVAAAADPQSACASLVALANQRGGPDNISVIVAKVLGENGRAVMVGSEHDDGLVTRPIAREAVSQLPIPARSTWKRVIRDVALAVFLIAAVILGSYVNAWIAAYFLNYSAGAEPFFADVAVSTASVFIVLNFISIAAWLVWRGKRS